MTPVIDVPTETALNLPPINVHDAIEKLVKVLRNEEKRKLVDSILSSYKSFDKVTIMNRSALLRDSLGILIGEEEATVLYSLITLVGRQDLQLFLDQCKTNEDKILLQEINAIYNPIFGGCDVSLPDDWLRIGWHSTIDFLTKEPMLTVRFFKRNGEHFDIQSKSGTWFVLINHIVRQLATVIQTTKGAKADKQFIMIFDQLKKDLDAISAKFTPIEEEKQTSKADS